MQSLSQWTFPRPSVATWFAFMLHVLLVCEHGSAEQPDRVSNGLLVLYTFEESAGDVIHDRSNIGKPLDLRIKNAEAVKRMDGHVVITASPTISSLAPATKIVDAVRASAEITIETWIKPTDKRQAGPARIVSISADTSQRNVTLGQDGNRYDVRFRTSGTDTNGIPSTMTSNEAVGTELSHVVFIRERNGLTRIYINGNERATSKAEGDVSGWNNEFRLSIANEQSGDRPWLGELHLVAIYSRALSLVEVQRNQNAGVVRQVRTSAQNNSPVAFEKEIAPLFAKHCLECHDSAMHKGGLDLSRKAAALTGATNGKVLGTSADTSSIWKLVESGKMPKGRAPLSAQDKAALKKWLDTGATWSVEAIDPANYLHEGHGTEVWAQRLTIPEYIASVKSAVGIDIGIEAREFLPPDLRADGFSNTAYNLSVDLKHVEAYAKLAGIIVDRMNIAEFAGRFSKERQFNDDKMREFVAAVGKWLLRGPLDAQEISVYRGLASAASSSGGDYDEAVRCIVEAMLQSPRFIYRIENQRGSAPSSNDRYELASRLSFILWGAPPDTELYQAADRGDLADHRKLEAQIQRMLKDPRAVERSVQFLSEWLNLDALTNLRPNAKTYPNWDPQLAADMREETLAFFKEIAWRQNRPLADLFNARVTYVTPRLAAHYGLKPTGNDLQKVDLLDVPGRGGLLTQGSTLTIGGDDASMVTRGLFVMHDLLRGTVNSPPPCVDTTPQPTKSGLTHRDIAETRIANVSCGVCHVRFEPLAFGLERFDGIGAYHTRDRHGNQLREDGEILFPGAAEPVKYKSTSELMDLLARSPRVQETLTWKAVQFALGRPLDAADAPTVAAIHKLSQQGGGTYSSLLTAIALSDLVQTTRKELNQ